MVLTIHYIDGLVQDCRNSNALAMEKMQQSCRYGSWEMWTNGYFTAVSLQRRGRHNGNFGVTGGIADCYNGNLWYHQNDIVGIIKTLSF